MKITISKLGKMFGISRTTLLYYDKINLLKPIEISNSGYRLYDEVCIEKLNKIAIMRETGLSLEQIKDIIDIDLSETGGILFKQLGTINDEIETLREKQRLIIKILSNSQIANSFKNNDVESINKVLTQASIIKSQKNMSEQKRLWHNKFEKISPEEHKMLLSILGKNAKHK